MSLLFTTVAARSVALEYRDGELVRTLAPGRHRRHRRAKLVTVDLREAVHYVAPQEILTSDGISARVTAAVRWQVADPVRFVEQADDPLALVHLATQIALREQLATLTFDELGRRGAAFDVQALTAAADLAGRRVGIEVLEVIVRDVILPAELRSAALDLVTAQVRGQARLEEARAETAALRSLANGARILDAHPALAQLRIVQAAPMGSTVVVRISDAEQGPGPS